MNVRGENMDQIKMGKLIAKQRKKKNLTQEDLALRLRVNSKSISRWENGNQAPDVSILQPLAKELDITVDELLNGEKSNINILKTKTEVIDVIDYDRHEYQITKIKDLPNKFNYEDNIIIEAYIFGIDMIVYEKMTLLTLKISDKTSNIIVRVVIPNNSLYILESIKLGTSWRFYGECFNKQYDGMSIIKMQQIPKLFNSLNDSEQEKYFFFESLNKEAVKSRKKESLKEKLKELE